MALPANARLTLMVTIDDGAVSGYPLQRRLEDESVTQWATVREGDGDGVLTYTQAPFTSTTVSGFVLHADYPVRVALNGQTLDGTTDLNVQNEGFVLLFKAVLNDPSFRVMIANPTDIASCLHGAVTVAV